MGATQTAAVQIASDGSLSVLDTLSNRVFFSAGPPLTGVETPGFLAVNTVGSYEFIFLPPRGAAIASCDLVAKSGSFSLTVNDPPIVQDLVGVRRPQTQEVASLTGTLDSGVPFGCWFANNPAVLEVPLQVDPGSGQITEIGELPLGVSLDMSADCQLTVTGAGAYAFVFLLPIESGVTFAGFEWIQRPRTFSRSQELGTTMLSVNDDNLSVTERNQRATFNLILSNQSLVDPTVVNTPINQGGTGGVEWKRRTAA